MEYTGNKGRNEKRNDIRRIAQEPFSAHITERAATTRKEKRKNDSWENGIRYRFLEKPTARE
jgi:hypothetical protein